MKEQEFDDRHWLEKCTLLIEKNILGVKLGIYGIGLLGLGLAFRSVRPFQKFKSPQEIPQFFIDRNVTLNGKVLRVDISSKPLLVVDHKPILGSSFRKKGELLINIEGITISGNGISWIQSVVVGTNIEFVPLLKLPDCLSCCVYQKKRDIGKHLVSIGFASVAPFNESLEANQRYTKYYKELLLTEDQAERKGMGMWWDKPRKFSLSEFLLSKVPLSKLKTVFSRS